MEQQFVEIGGVWYFPADDGMHGRELWRSDGTAEGTSMVRDICPGLCSGSPSSLAGFGSELAFAAWDGEHGVELWLTDGSHDGTRMVADLRPGPESSQPLCIREHNSLILFSADRRAEGRELWRSDGTAAGTYLLADLSPGAAGSNTGCASSIGSLALFTARVGAGVNQLYRTDGDLGGTQQVGDFPGGVSAGYPWGPNRWAVSNGRLYFAAQDNVGWQLWSTDGTEAGTLQLTQLTTAHTGIGWLTESQGKIFFIADDGTGRELWVSDGSAAGTSIVKDLETFPSQGSPWYLIDTPGGLLFSGFQSATGHELWRSDGTESGTYLVKELVPGTSSSLVTANMVWYQAEWIRVGGRALFLVELPSGALERWASDGTAAGTQKVSDVVQPGSAPVFFQSASSRDEILLLEGKVVRPTLIRTDGTVSGTQALLVPDGFSSSYPHQMTDVDGRVYLRTTDAALTAVTRGWLRQQDGSIAPMASVAPAVEALVALQNDPPTRSGSRLYFASRSSTTERLGLFTTALDFSDLRQVPLVEPIFGGGLFDFGGGLHFWGDPDPTDGYDVSLLRVDDPAQPVHEIVGPSRHGGFAPDIVRLAPEAFLSSGQGLWSIDAQAVGTDHAPTLLRSHGLRAIDTGAGDAIAFTAIDPSAGREVHVLDPSTGSVTLMEIHPGPEDGTPEAIWTRQIGAIEPTFPDGEPRVPLTASASAGALYLFVGNDGLSGTELWATTALGPPYLVADIAPGAGSSHPSALLGIGGQVFFRADDGVHGSELWVSDGSAAGTRMLGDLRPGSESSLPQELTAVGSNLLFSAHDGTHGRELWISDGGPNGTRLVSDIAAGAGSSSPLSFLVQEEVVLFVANDGIHGFELWALDRPVVNEADLIFGTGFEGSNLTSWTRTIP